MARLLAPAAVLAGLFALVLTTGPLADTRITDVFVYEHYAGLLADGTPPYSAAFGLEYPPLALVPMWLAHVLGGDYATTFGVLMGVCAAIACVAVGRLGGQRAAWAFVVLPVLGGAVLRTHFDLFAVVFLLAALVALRARHTTTAFVLFGIATMIKLFPLVVAGVAACWLWGRGERASAVRGAAACAAVIAVCSLPFAGQGYVDAYRYHFDRPVQIESTPASVLWLAGGSQITGTTEAPDEFGSNGMVGGAADVVRALSGVAQVAALALIALLAARRRDERQLLLCCAAAVVAFVALGKVFSPQYVAWLAPFAALLLAARERLIAALLAGSIVLTTIEFPRHYLDLVEGDRGVALLVGARNALLLAALGLLIARAAGAARSPTPAAAAART
ncbi:MAG: glycosyltransferase 87 family protein [Solirubrobacteraceae bacterium]